MAAPNLFNAALKKADAPGEKVKKAKAEFVTCDDAVITKAIKDFCDAKDKEKSAKAEAGIAKVPIEEFANARFVEKFAEDGIKPESFKIIGDDESQVTFIAQDRSGNYPVSDEQLEQITEAIGSDKANDLICETTTYSFSPEILRKKGVMEFLGRAMQTLVKNGVLTDEEVNELLVAKVTRVIKPGTLTLLANICEQKLPVMKQLVTALDSNVSTYIK